MRGQRHAPAALYPRERPGTGGWVSPRAGLDRCGKSRPQPGFNPRTVQPVASRYTDYATRPTQAHCTTHEMGTTALWARYMCSTVSSNSNMTYYNNNSDSYLDLEVMTAAVSGGSGDLALVRTACRVELE